MVDVCVDDQRVGFSEDYGELLGMYIWRPIGRLWWFIGMYIWRPVSWVFRKDVVVDGDVCVETSELDFRKIMVAAGDVYMETDRASMVSL